MWPAQEATNATYEVGDMRALPVADGAYDGAFCDKVPIHAAPAAALGELVRAVHTNGRVGVVEWYLCWPFASSGPFPRR